MNNDYETITFSKERKIKMGNVTYITEVQNYSHSGV